MTIGTIYSEMLLSPLREDKTGMRELEESSCDYKFYLVA